MTAPERDRILFAILALLRDQRREAELILDVLGKTPCRFCGVAVRHHLAAMPGQCAFGPNA
jgi:hypothetical protein